MILERTVCEPREIEDVDEELASAAYQFLGYPHAHETIEHAGQSLRRALKELGIKPFKAESVEKYKRQQLWRANLRVYKAAALWFAVGLIGAAGFGLCVSPFVPSPWAQLLGVPGLLVAVAGTVAAGVCIWADDPPKGLERRVWTSENLSRTQIPIPEFALQTAIDVKKQCSGVSFTVEFMSERRGPVRWDPFLVASFNGEEFYLEVWNEPGFKQQREV